MKFRLCPFVEKGKYVDLNTVDDAYCSSFLCKYWNDHECSYKKSDEQT